MKIEIKKLQYIFLFLYLFFLSFFNYTPFYLISAMLLVIFTFIKIISSDKKIKFTSYFWFQIFFIGYNIVYVLLGWSINSIHTVDAIKTVVLNLLINLAIMNTINSQDDIKKVLDWFVPITVFASIYVILYTRGAGADGRIAQGVIRPFSSTPYTSMNFASWALYASVIATINLFEKKQKINVIYIILFWVVIIWAGSRKWISAGLILESITFFFYNSKKINFKTVIITSIEIVILLSVIIVLMFKNETLYNIAGSRFIGFLSGTESSAKSRNTMKETAIEYIKKNPIKGYGLNTFRDVSIFNNWSESNYLELSFGNGIWMTVLNYLYLLFIAKKLFNLRKEDKFNIILMSIILMFIIFDTVSMSYCDRLSTFFITICSISLYLHKKDEKNEKENISVDVYV